MSVIVERSGHLSVFMKGAVERIILRCSRVAQGSSLVNCSEEYVHELVDPVISEMAEFGLRVMALAAKGACFGEELELNPTDCFREHVERDLVLIGLVGMQDPPRAGVKDAVDECRQGGIVVRMLTGDHLLTARQIAIQVGIINDQEYHHVCDAATFDSYPETRLSELAELPLVVARCTPESKVRMVHALHNQNKVVAMTGDGVNDAPALQAANVGVAMGKSGSDLARQTAHIVLADDNFVSIVAGVREGRRILFSVKKFLVMMLTANVGMALLLMVGLAFRDEQGLVIWPQTALEILAANMLFETMLVMGIVTEPPTGDLMLDLPYKSKTILTRDMLIDMIVYATLYGGCAVGVFSGTLYGAYHGAVASGCNSSNGSPACQPIYAARGATFLCQACMLIFAAYNSRHARDPVWKDLTTRPWNFFLLVVSLIVLLLSILFVFVPVLNLAVFQHSSLTFEIGIALAGVAVFMVLSTIWKLLAKSRAW